MRKYIIPLFILLFAANIALSANIDQKQAEKAAIHFFYERINQYENISLSDIKVEEVFVEIQDSETAFYIFNLNHPGFIIVAATDQIYPVLGYSFDGKYSPIDPPVQFQGLIYSYKLQVSYAIDNPFEPADFIRSEWDRLLTDDPNELIVYTDEKDIEPMLTTTWDQGSFYNELCPADAGGPGGHCVTGCVATALGQLVNYFRWPDTGLGSYSYSWPPYGTLSADFGNTTYRWDEMGVALYNTNLPVATILSHLGISVDMEYSANSSGMTNHKGAYTLRTYFKYSPETQYVFRDSTTMDWDSLLITHLDKHIPMYYAGWSNPWISGHAFICDGYQGDHHYHFNWGWGSSYDGYFYTDNLNPGGSNFNNAQELIINAFPDTVLYQYPYYCQGADTLKTFDGTIDDGSGPVYDYSDNASCSWLIAPDDSVNNITISFLKFETDASDVMTIYDGESSTAPVLGTYSGPTLPDDVVSSGDKVFITFDTDGSGVAPGWLLTYSSENPVYCSGLVQLTQYDSDTFSDGSGSRDYHNGTQCLWKILPEGAGTVSLFFDSFKTEEDADYVSVYDLVTLDLLGEYSGDMGQPGMVATSMSGQMFVTWSTNASITDEGWEAYYIADWVGVEELPNNLEIKVYPVPVKDELNISIRNTRASKVQIDLISVSGMTILSQEHSLAGKENISIGTDNITNGIYILRIKTGGEYHFKKIVIQK